MRTMASQMTSVLICLLNRLIKENIGAPPHWPLRGEFTGDGEFPLQRSSNAENFPFDDVIMMIYKSRVILQPARLYMLCDLNISNMV